ncbi:1-deoxy-D-xylulose-5-phosphate reductoisomerase [Rhizobiaceae bacterium BDR2-2]|uniref:1-deoxy-D-xylulose 5-phosphate reductoisomerase n=1 Tax=Ectorhizobium quercum TaxID=2965071 RepID=A0AAE3MZ15_9HYPH|nr:1-deoxy-D-xylulose-5-phosphate reductoisomerase [Ectorhizobium quercum]MCX8996931.1 1-deoxy-D-xylulose-5-phosphate reductoisomerase [Ectorhizobium quercum]
MTEAASSRRRITILGSTGSIGTNTLDVVAGLGGREAFDVMALTGNGNIRLLAEQAKTFGARLAVTASDDHYADLKDALSGTGIAVAAGKSGLAEAAAADAGWVMAAIVGTAGLAPTLTAARRGADIALANKECLVSAGRLFVEAVSKGGGRLLPVDSEHNAIFQVLEENQRHALERIILTASGGPFRNWTLRQMGSVTVETARAHPNWSMGLKISIDSASLFNKALEMIEAQQLFRLRPDQIEVVVHPQSVIHSMVGYADGSVLAQLGCPDMRTAIGYALTYPRRTALPVERLDFARIARLDFEAPDPERFPALRLAREAMEAGGVAGAVLNGAKEVALDAFIAERIRFLDMPRIVERTMAMLSQMPAAASIEDVFAADEKARQVAAGLL